MKFYGKSTDSFKETSLLDKKRLVSACIRVGYLCNLYCSYCLSNSSPGKNETTGKIEALIRTISKNGPIRLVWSGGEPLLYRELTKWLEISRKIGNVNVVATNGEMFPERSILLNSDWFQVSCPSTNNEIYKTMRGSDGLPCVLKNIENLIGMGSNVSVNIPLCEINYNSVFQTIKYFTSVGIRKIVVTRVMPIGRGGHLSNMYLPDDRVMQMKDRLHEFLEQNKVKVVWPAIQKMEDLKNGYFVFGSNGDILCPEHHRPLNILSDEKSAWKFIQIKLPAHLNLFFGEGH